MDLARVRREVEEAKKSFPLIESHPTTDGRLYVLGALQTSPGRYYTLSISFPDIYPNGMPLVSVRKPALHESAPHRYSNGHICYLHHRMWNPGRHNLTFVIWRAAKWLNKYEVWLQTWKWPGAEILH